MSSDAIDIVRLSTPLRISRQPDGSFKVQKPSNLETIAEADIKGDTLMFRKKAMISGLSCRAITLTIDDMKALGIWTGTGQA